MYTLVSIFADNILVEAPDGKPSEGYAEVYQEDETYLAWEFFAILLTTTLSKWPSMRRDGCDKVTIYVFTQKELKLEEGFEPNPDQFLIRLALVDSGIEVGGAAAQQKLPTINAILQRMGLKNRIKVKVVHIA